MKCEEHPDREATWHLRYVCPMHREDVTFPACIACKTLFDEHTSDHGAYVEIHPLQTDCRHPSSQWAPEVCIIPTTEMTIDDLIEVEELAPA